MKAKYRILEDDLAMFVNNLHFHIKNEKVSNASRCLNCFLLVAKVLWVECSDKSIFIK